MRFLDYLKVKEAERERGRELFGTEEEPTALAAKVRLPNFLGTSVALSLLTSDGLL